MRLASPGTYRISTQGTPTFKKLTVFDTATEYEADSTKVDASSCHDRWQVGQVQSPSIGLTLFGKARALGFLTQDPVTSTNSKSQESTSPLSICNGQVRTTPCVELRAKVAIVQEPPT